MRGFDFISVVSLDKQLNKLSNWFGTPQRLCDVTAMFPLATIEVILPHPLDTALSRKTNDSLADVGSTNLLSSDVGHRATVLQLAWPRSAIRRDQTRMPSIFFDSNNMLKTIVG